MLQGGQARWCGPLSDFRERFAVVEAPTPAEGVPGARILHREQVLAGWSLVLELAEPQEFAAWLSRNGLAARRPSLGQIATVLWQR